MTAVPVVRTWTASEVVTAANMNTYLRDVDSWLLAPAVYQGYNTANQSLTTSTWTSLLMDAEAVDSTGMHSTVTNTSRMTAVYPGWYNLTGSCTWASNATGQRGCRWIFNGATPGAAPNGYAVIINAAATGALGLPHTSIKAFLNVGDYAEAQGFQSSGGNLNTGASGGFNPFASAKWESN